MIKAVLQSFPLNVMSCLKLPSSICNKITSEITKFLWNSNNNVNKIHWISWDDLCKHKSQEGLGLRDLLLFNPSMLAKQAWKLATQEDSLLHSFFKSLYFKDSLFLDAPAPRNSSFIWKGILWGLDKGIGWRIGNDCRSNIWKSNWLRSSSSFKAITTPTSDSAPQMVVDLITIKGGKFVWDYEKVKAIFPPIGHDRILNVCIPHYWSPDVLAWLPHWDGICTVRKGYFFARFLQSLSHSQPETSAGNHRYTHKFCKVLWSCPQIPRIIYEAWQAVKDRLPTSVNLHKRGILTHHNCQYCLTAPESLPQILYECDFAKEFWSYGIVKHYHRCCTDSLFFHWCTMLHEDGLAVLCLELVCCRFLWRARNDRLFSNFHRSDSELWRICMQFINSQNDILKSSLY